MFLCCPCLVPVPWGCATHWITWKVHRRQKQRHCYHFTLGLGLAYIFILGLEVFFTQVVHSVPVLSLPCASDLGLWNTLHNIDSTTNTKTKALIDLYTRVRFSLHFLHWGDRWFSPMSFTVISCCSRLLRVPQSGWIHTISGNLVTVGMRNTSQDFQ